MSSQLSDISKYTNNAQKIMQAAEAALATMIKSEKELMESTWRGFDKYVRRQKRS